MTAALVLALALVNAICICISVAAAAAAAVVVEAEAIADVVSSVADDAARRRRTSRGLLFDCILFSSIEFMVARSLL